MPDLIASSNFKGATALKSVYYLPLRMGIPREVASVFWYMLGFYILLITLGVRPLISAGGAIAFSIVITSYSIHYTKLYDGTNLNAKLFRSQFPEIY